MAVEGDALGPQARCLPVDGAEYPQGRERKASERARETCAADFASLEGKSGVEYLFAVLQIHHVDCEPPARRRETPLVVDFHRHEGRYVEAFAEPKTQPSGDLFVCV